MLSSVQVTAGLKTRKKFILICATLNRVPSPFHSEVAQDNVAPPEHCLHRISTKPINLKLLSGTPFGPRARRPLWGCFARARRPNHDFEFEMLSISNSKSCGVKNLALRSILCKIWVLPPLALGASDGTAVRGMVCTFSGSFLSSSLVPAKRRYLVPPTNK